jgi:hypothetical protein
MAQTPIQYTSIVTTVRGIVVSVRSHAGHMDDHRIEMYLSGHEGLHTGDRIRFDHIDLYSDIGDSVHRVEVEMTCSGQFIPVQ